METVTAADVPDRLRFQMAAVAGTVQVFWTVLNLKTLDDWAGILFQSVAVAVLALVLTAVPRLREIGLGIALGLVVGVALTWGLLSAWIIMGNNL